MSGEGEGDLKGRLATARSELEAVSLERNALVSAFVQPREGDDLSEGALS